MTYQIPAEGVTWSALFRTVEQNKEQFHIIDYSVSQTTLEQVRKREREREREKEREGGREGGRERERESNRRMDGKEKVKGHFSLTFIGLQVFINFAQEQEEDEL